MARTDVAVVGLHARHAQPPDPTWAPPTGMPLVSSRLPRTALYEAWNRLGAARSWRAADHPEVVHATTWAIPPGAPGLVVTVHDLAFLRSPEHFTARGTAFFHRALDHVRTHARAVIAVSEATRQDCIDQGIEPERVRVVHHGVRVPETTPEQVAGLRSRYGITRPYVLWCGTLEPRKNVAGLVRAFAELVEGHDVDLVLAGPTGWGDDAPVRDALATVPEHRVHRVGALSWPELHAAYEGASALCFPSLWEGFGMPVLEAMAHGVPVVTSRDTSMAEIAHDGGAVLVDPRDPSAIADGLARALGPDHDGLADRARRHAAGFTWQRCAEQTVEVYRAAAER
jgi:glycosyltransferase involved in cell wall biosynthesis